MQYDAQGAYSLLSLHHYADGNMVNGTLSFDESPALPEAGLLCSVGK